MSDGKPAAADSRPSSLQRVDLDKTPMRRFEREPARPIVVVLGMHRSGTSLLSNMLHLLGIDMSDTSDRVNEKNAGGFWERPDMFRLQDEVLAAIGRPIDQPSHVLPFPAAWWRRKEVQALKPKLIAYLREQLEKSANPWGFKDPRTCRLLPLWWEVFREVNVEPVYIHAIRSPIESAVSMAEQSKARKISYATGELMWLSYNYDIARHVTVKQPPLLVDYDDWFDDPIGTAQRLVDALGIGGDLSQQEFEECVTSTVRAEFRHQAEPKDSAGPVPLADMLYGTLTTDGERRTVDIRQLRGQMRLVDVFFKSVGPMLDDLDAVVARQAELDEASQRDAEERAAIVEEERRASGERLAQLQDELGRALEEVLAARSMATAAEERASQLQEEHKVVLEQLVAAKDAASVAEKLARDASELTQKRARERDQARREAEQAKEELVAARNKQREQEQQLAALAKRLETRRAELTHARRAAPEQPGESVFAWPSNDTELPAVNGSIAADERGIRGAVAFDGRPDLMPVVELRIGELVAAQFCTRDGGDAAEGWPFEIPWSRIADEHAGREVVIKVAGVDRELGRARVPDDLHEYHLSPAALAAKVIGGSSADAAEYHRWILVSESHRDIELARSYYGDSKTEWPTIRAIVYGGGERSAAMQSLREQIYRNWEAIVIGDLPDQMQDDPRFRVVSPAEFEAALEDYDADALFTFVEAGDVISPTALLHLAIAAQQTPDFSLIYSDEDRIDPRFGVRGLPHMKGEWSPDLGLSLDYVCRLALVRRNRIGEMGELSPASVYAIALRAALSGSGPVKHVPFVLYHRAASNVPEGADLASAVEAVVQESPVTAQAKVVRLPAGRWKVEWPLPDQLPAVSLIVPTRDRVDLLKVAVEGFLNGTNYQNVEVVIVDNDSSEEETRAYLEKLGTHPRIRVVRSPGAFNFSRLNNLGVKKAAGSIIGLMNNDLKVSDPEWLRHMVAHAVRPDVGIVGAKLLHGDDTIQHAGVTLGIGVASHIYKSSPPNAEGHHRRLVLPHDVSAVTAACLLIRREVWDEVGGLDEAFPVAYNDVDLCLKVTAHGYRVLWTPEAVVYHLESQSRGKETTPEKRERLEQEKARLLKRWGERVASDPFHSPNLSIKEIDARLAFPPRAAPPWRPLAA